MHVYRSQTLMTKPWYTGVKTGSWWYINACIYVVPLFTVGTFNKLFPGSSGILHLQYKPEMSAFYSTFARQLCDDIRLPGWL